MTWLFIINNVYYPLLSTHYGIIMGMAVPQTVGFVS